MNNSLFHKFIQSRDISSFEDTIPAGDSILQSENFKYGEPLLPFGGPDTFQCIFGTDTLTLVITSTNLLCNGDNSGTACVQVSGGTPPYTYDWSTGATTSCITGLGAGNYGVDVYDASGINFCYASINVNEPPPISINISPPAPVTSCFGDCDGTATVVAGGGTPPYSYLWSDGQTTQTATGLCAGTYTITVTDANGCTKIKNNVLIGQPPPLSPNGSSTNVTCFGLCDGTACVLPFGGNPPYTYLWNTGATTSCITGLCAPQTLTCTVTDTQTCTATYITTITEPPPLTVTLTPTNLLCNGVCTGSIVATASGGTFPYTYSWAPGGATTSAITGLCAGNYTLTLTDASGCALTNTVALTQPPALTLTVTNTNVTCFSNCDGSMTASVSGGTPGYAYSWSNGCTASTCSNVCAGNYSVVVTDTNGCTITNTVSVTEPAVLTVTVSATNVTCNSQCNGSVNASVSGGTTPYTYSWSSGCTTSSCPNLCAGTYSLLVTDANGCTIADTIIITEPSAISLNLSSTPASCNGTCDGSVSSLPTGGTSPYTYLWNPGGFTTSAVSGLCAGTYTLTLTDANGCTSTGTISITQPNVLSVSISASPNPLNCNGDCNGTAVVSVSGGTAPYTYLWNPSGETTAAITGLCAGNYSITVTDANGCTGTNTVVLAQPTTLSVTIASSDPTCNGQCDGSISAIAGGGTPGYTFNWLPGGQTTSSISGLCDATYTLTVTDNNGCSFTQTITLTAPAVLFANPSVVSNVLCAGQCNGIASSSPVGGTAPYTFLWSTGQTTSAISGLCAGTYSVTVTDANNCTDIQSITITQPLVLSSSVAFTTSSCTLCTGSGTVSTSGGTTPYTYLWSPGGQTTSSVSGLCIGNYSISVTDANGCTNSLTVTINPVVTVSVSVSGTTVSCFGSCDGVATATPFGGDAPYTYLWLPGGQTSSTVTGLCAGTYTVIVADTNGCDASDSVIFTNPPLLTVSVSSTTASCGLCNGTATASPSGGTGGYTYTWSVFPIQTTQTATGLCSGTYTVTVNDANNCTSTATVSVGNIPNLSVTPSVTDANCGLSDGSICLSPSGGTPPYTYSWAPGGQTTSCITGIPAGIYTVTITDAAGCSSTSSIPVNNISGPTITLNSAIDPVCNNDCNGSISVTASGANPPFTYLWSPGGETTNSITGLCAGTYIVQATNSVSCTSFSSITLNNPPPISPNPVITNVSCNGGNNGMICLSPSGGVSPYTYAWSPGGQTTSCATGLSAGNYTVTITDAGGCSDTYTIPVSQPTALTVTLSSTNVTCNGNCDGTATANVSGGTGTYTYLWSTGSPLPSIVGLCPGPYSVTVTDNNGCTTTASITITEPTVLTTTISFSDVTCYSACDGSASISASGGTLPYTYLWSPGGQTTSSITGLCPGNYAATVTDANGCSSTQSITITQPSALSVSVISTGATCFGSCDGTALASVSGGTPPYTYLWNPGGATTSAVTGLCAGSYTFSVTDANGCNTIQLFSISQPSLLQPNITAVSPSCFSGCDGSATSSPIGGTAPYTFLWSNGQTTSTATGLCAGTYTLTLSDANGCSVVQTINITQPSVISIPTGVAQATCGLCNGSITAAPSGGTPPYTYLWNPSGETTAAITGLCAGLYTITVTDTNGCSTYSVIPLSNTTGPSLSVSGANVTCFGACNGTATVTATGDAPFTYLWTPGGQTTSAATGLCPASPYFIQVTDINGCITIDSIYITEPPQLTIISSVTNATCFGLCDGAITVSAAGGTGSYTYLWAPGGETTASISNVCAGNYTLVITDANNCTLTNTFTVGQNTIITSTVTPTNALCNGSCDGTATVIASGGTLPYTYLWNPTGQTASAATGLCTGTHTITITDAIGCIQIDSAIITEPAILSPNITGINLLCNGDCNGSVSASPSGGTPPYTYLWSSGCTTSSCTGLCAGIYTLTLTDANNCSAVDSISLTEPPVLTSSDIITNASCSNVCDGSIDLTPSGGTAPYTFLWSPNGQTSEDITGLCAGVYSVTITDTNGCSFTDSMTVSVITLVIADAGNDTGLCIGQTATLCSNSFGAASVEWYQLPGWISLGNTTCISVSPPVGNTSYALVATNGICSDTDTVVVAVNNYPVVLASNDTTICEGSSVTLCASGASNYQWYQLPAWTPVATGNCINITPSVGTTSYGVIGANGVCSDTDSVAVTVIQMPIANAGNDTAFCLGDSTILCSNSVGAVSVAWYNIPSWTQIDTTTCITVTPSSGINNYALIATNGICADTDYVSVNVYSLPLVDAGSNVTILATGSTVLNGTGGGTYWWMPPWGLSDTAVANPVASPSVTTTYTLLVTDVNGCSASDAVTVTVVPDVIVNDGLSPNGDGINDIWEITNIELFPDAVVEIYNRWGELLFRSVGYKEKWDCTYNGKPLPVGTYYYVINLNSDLHQDPITGPLTILR